MKKTSFFSIIMIGIVMIVTFVSCKKCSDVEWKGSTILSIFESEVKKSIQEIDQNRKGRDLKKCDSLAWAKTFFLDSLYKVTMPEQIGRLIEFSSREFRANTDCSDFMEGDNSKRINAFWDAMGGDEKILGKNIKILAPRFYESLSSRLKWLLEAYLLGGERRQVIYNGKEMPANYVEEEIVNLLSLKYDEDWLKEKKPDYYGPTYKDDIFWPLYFWALDPKNKIKFE